MLVEIEGRYMKALWDWLKDPNNQGALKIIGAAIAAVAVAGFTLFQLYLGRQPAQPLAVSVCRGDTSQRCPSFDVFVGCGNFDDGIKDLKEKCKSITSVETFGTSGGACGYSVIRFTCVHK
jgi:hypothetical protein